MLSISSLYIKPVPDYCGNHGAFFKILAQMQYLLTIHHTKLIRPKVSMLNKVNFDLNNSLTIGVAAAL
jgi:hypothetical protein